MDSIYGQRQTADQKKEGKPLPPPPGADLEVGVKPPQEGQVKSEVLVNPQGAEIPPPSPKVEAGAPVQEQTVPQGVVGEQAVAQGVTGGPEGQAGPNIIPHSNFEEGIRPFAPETPQEGEIEDQVSELNQGYKGIQGAGHASKLAERFLELRDQT
jgi:hypothetical protein